MIQVKATAGKFFYTIDWTDEIPAGVFLQDVIHTVPVPLTLDNEGEDTVAGTSTILVRGGAHGGIYLIEAAATLTNGEVIPGSFPIRVFNG